MKQGGLKYFILALIFGLLAALGSYIYLSSQEAAPGEVEMIELPVAVEAIDRYSKLSRDQFEIRKFPAASAVQDTVTELKDIEGKYAATEILANEPIRAARLRDSIEDVITEVIKPGHRAISIQTDRFSAAADLIVPGDRVDLIVFLPEKTRKETVIREDMAQIFIENAKVLAVSQTTLPGVRAHEEIPERYALTIEVPVGLTKEIVLAEKIGSVKVALRGSDDAGVESTSPVQWEDLQ